MIIQAYFSDLFRWGPVTVVMLAATGIWIDQRLHLFKTNHLCLTIRSKVSNFCSNNYLFLQLAIPLALVVFILFVSGRNGIIIGPDTEARFEVARQILDRTALQKASSDRPPALPFLVALTHLLFDTSFERSIQYINGLLFVGNVLLVFKIVFTSTRSGFLSYMGLITVFLSGHFRLLHVQSGEEPMHIYVTLLSMFFIMRYMRNKNITELLTSAFFASIAPLVKTAGIVNPIAFCLVAVLMYKNKTISTFQLVLLGISSVLFLSAWQLRHWLVGEPIHYAPVILSDVYARIWPTVSHAVRIIAHYMLAIEIGSIIYITAYLAFVTFVSLAIYRYLDSNIISDLVVCSLYHYVIFLGVVFLVVISPASVMGLLRHLAAAFVCAIPTVYLMLQIVSERLAQNEGA